TPQRVRCALRADVGDTMVRADFDTEPATTRPVPGQPPARPAPTRDPWPAQAAARPGWSPPTSSSARDSPRRPGTELEELRCRRTARPRAGGLVRGVEQSHPTAHAGVREDQVDQLGALAVAGDRGDDAADLFEPGQSEERRRAPVGLRPDDVEPRLG